MQTKLVVSLIQATIFRTLLPATYMRKSKEIFYDAYSRIESKSMFYMSFNCTSIVTKVSRAQILSHSNVLV